MNLTHDDLALFCSKFSIYRKRYNKKYKDQWILQDFYLTDEKLLESINNPEESDVAYFSCYKTNFFAIDIDNHNGNTDLKKSYEVVLSKLGQPSLISKSPRGLHLYFSIKEKISADYITELLEEKFIDYDFEFKPVSDSALRTINSNKLLDSNLEILNKEFIDIILESNTYNFSELFYETKNKKVSNKITTTTQWSVINKGETNEAIKCLIPIWKSQGYNEDSCVRMFQAKLSSDYNGECLHYDRLLKRVKSFFRKDILWSTTESKIDSSSIEKKYSEQINLAISLHRKKYNKVLPRQEEIIKNMIIFSFLKKEKSLELYSNPRSLAYMSTKYPFFDYEVGNGNTPLPSSTFKIIASNYQHAMNFLFVIGFLSRKHGRSYDSIRGSCQYYFVDTDYHKKYSEYAYSTVLDISQVKSSVKELLSLGRKVIMNFVEKNSSLVKLVKENICYNMFLVFKQVVSGSKEVNQLFFSG